MRVAAITDDTALAVFLVAGHEIADIPHHSSLENLLRVFRHVPHDAGSVGLARNKARAGESDATFSRVMTESTTVSSLRSEGICGSTSLNEPYNLVLLDWKMPEMDGLAVTREIRKRYDKETTVIILTAYNWDEIMDEALRTGVDSFLSKPLFASNVIDEFERVARKNNLSLAQEKKRADLKGRRILLAEDIVINAEIVKEIVRMREAEIDHAENGRVALELFEKSEVGGYAAILMDVRMPEMDGLEATAAIRALDRPDAKTVPIIAMTANAFDEDVQRSLQAGMNAHLSKPIEPERLFETLEELIWDADEKRNRA